MTTEYRKERVGSRIFVIDPWGEQVGVYFAEQEADEAIELCKEKDAMRETANLLVETAIKAHMELHGVDRETARHWVFNAAEETY